MSYRDDPTAEPDGARRQEEESVLEAGERKVRQLWGGFVDFALKDNVLEVACGLMYVMWPLSGWLCCPT